MSTSNIPLSFDDFGSSTQMPAARLQLLSPQPFLHVPDTPQLWVSHLEPDAKGAAAGEVCNMLHFCAGFFFNCSN